MKFPSWLKWLIIFVVTVIVVRRLYELGNGRTFFYDEWQFVIHRRSLSWSSLVEPHNGHLSFLPALAYWIMLQLFGLDQFVPFRLMGLAVHLAISGMVGLLVTRRWNWVVGCAAALAIALMGGGWQNILWPFQIGFMGSLLFFLLAVYAFDRSENGQEHSWILASSFFCLGAVLCSGVGLPAVGAMALLCWCIPARAKVWWVPVPAIVIYAIWYVFYGRGGQSVGEFAQMPAYVGESGQSAVSAFFNVNTFFGWLGCLAIVGVVLYAYRQQRLTWRTTVWLIALLSFWLLNAFTRAGVSEPDASRYVYLAVVLLVLTLSDLLPLWRDEQKFRVVVSCLVVVVSLLAVQRSDVLMQKGAAGLRWESTRISIELAVIDEIGDYLDPNFEIDPVHSPGLTVGDYLDAKDDLYSSAAYPIESVLNARADNALAVDRILRQTLFFEPVEYPAGQCKVTATNVKDVHINVGETVFVMSDKQQEATITRFVRPNELPVASESIATGVYVIEAPLDPFEKPWTVSFSNTVNRVNCE